MKTIAYLFIAIVLISCGSEPEGNVVSNVTIEKSELKARAEMELSPAQYVSWANERSNGLFASKKIENIEYAIFAKPVDYILSKEILNHVTNENDYSKAKSELSDLQYFDFRITVDNYHDEFLRYNLSSADQYQDRIDYCAFNMQNDIRLLNGSDSIPCVLFHFERSYSLVPYGHFLLAFQKTNLTSDHITFYFRDNLMQNGIIKLIVNKDALSHLPKLKLS
jgi:hypothetical protein